MIDLEAIKGLGDIPAAQARVRGAETAIVFRGRSTSYAVLERRSAVAAAALIASGAATGARICVLTKNHERWYELFFGCIRARACLAPINCRLAAPEVAFILGDAAPAILFVGEGFFDIALSALAGLVHRPRLVALHGSHPEFEPYDAWYAAAGSANALPQPEDGDDAIQLYTSGTTGAPKGVVLTNRNYRRWMEMASTIEGFSYDPGDTALLVMPLFHVAGANMSIAALAQGGRIVLEEDFNAAAALETMSRERVANAFLAPAMILMMLQSPALAGQDFSALKVISYGASPIAIDVLRRAQQAFGCGFVQFYGMTESTGGGTYLPPSAHGRADLLKSCGIAWPETEVAILGPDGAILPAGEIGEIAIRSDIVMKGYWRREDATAESLAGGWLHTGDVGYMNADGFFFVHDRLKDMIISGGENVYPAEVENAIQGCPGVADVAVIGVPDERWGEAVKALIVCDGDGATEAQVIAWARARIAAFKAPKSVEFIDALPRNPSGKVLRRELRERFWHAHGRAVG
jgi:acyl-CoA synthetase (AMP-forming)/AMP-acid ligase II